MELPIKRPLILDGGTQDAFLSYGFTPELCFEQWILDNPSALKALQTAYINAGSDVLYTPTFSANKTKLAKHNLEDKVKSINETLAKLTRENACDKFVAGCMSSASDSIAEMTFAELISIYREQAQALAPHVDFFVAENLSSLVDIRAVILAVKRFKKPLFITIELLEDGKTVQDLSPISALITAQAMGAYAFGVSAQGIEVIETALKSLLSYTKIPLIAQPSLNPSTPDFSESIRVLIENGATILGGYSGTTPEHISALKSLIDSTTVQNLKSDVVKNTDDLIILSSSSEAFFLSPDRIEISPIIKASYDMTDELLEYSSDETSIDILHIDIETPDDAIAFAENQHMATLPVMFFSHDELALKSALLLYQGIALIDSESPIDEAYLEQISKKYGAIIY